jgi:hypothetical protein
LHHLGGADEIDLPTGELDREAHVLALATDGERQLLVIDHDGHFLLVAIDPHARDPRRR